MSSLARVPCKIFCVSFQLNGRPPKRAREHARARSLLVVLVRGCFLGVGGCVLGVFWGVFWAPSGCFLGCLSGAFWGVFWVPFAYELGDPRTDVTLRPDAVRVHRGQLLTFARNLEDAKRGKACQEGVAGKNILPTLRCPKN